MCQKVEQISLSHHPEIEITTKLPKSKEQKSLMNSQNEIVFAIRTYLKTDYFKYLCSFVQ